MKRFIKWARKLFEKHENDVIEFPERNVRQLITAMVQYMDADVRKFIGVPWKFTMSVSSYNGEVTECDPRLDFVPEYPRANDFRSRLDPDSARETKLASDIMRVIQLEIATNENFRFYMVRRENGDTNIIMGEN